MAIKLPDPGNGIPEQKTGNDEWTNMKIVRDNFADNSNAASRLVGVEKGRIPLAEHVQEAHYTKVTDYTSYGVTKVANLPLGSVALVKPSHGAGDHPQKTGMPANTEWHITTLQVGASTVNAKQVAFSNSYNGANEFATRGLNSATFGGEWQAWVFYYHTGNTTKDSNGFLKASSPVLRVFSDRIEGNDDGEKLGAIFVKNGVGDYLIKGTTGLAQEGWYIELPQDANKNPLVAVEYKDLGDGVISVKTYKRTFDMHTFMFAPDKSQPLDIPEGRWIDLRFNDLPEEQLDEPAI